MLKNIKLVIFKLSVGLPVGNIKIMRIMSVTHTHLAGGSDNADGGLLSRSKSASSVTNLGAGVTNVGTSSLSLNDVEVLEQAEVATIEGKSDLGRETSC